VKAKGEARGAWRVARAERDDAKNLQVKSANIPTP